MSQWRADVTLDARGLSSPQPTILARNLLRDMPSGQVLEVMGDDPTLLENLTAFCDRSGDKLLGHEKREGCVSYFLGRV